MDNILIPLMVAGALMVAVCAIGLLCAIRPIHLARGWWQRRGSRPEQAENREVVVVLRDEHARPLVRFYAIAHRRCYGAAPFFVTDGAVARAIGTGRIHDALVLMALPEDHGYDGPRSAVAFVFTDEVVEGEKVVLRADTVLTHQWARTTAIPYPSP